MKLRELGSSVESLSGVGPATAKLFSRLNIFTVADLLSTFPRDWEDRTKKVPLKDFALHSKVHTVCKVLSHQWFGYGSMRTLKIQITDGTLKANLIAFNRGFLEKSLPVGSIISVTGKFDIKYNEIQSSSFEAEKLSNEGNLDDWENESIPNSGLIPIYPLTEGLSQKTFRKVIKIALSNYGKNIDNEIPDEIIKSRNLISKAKAISDIHLSNSMDEVLKAKETLIYEELYNFEYKMALRCLEHRGSLNHDSIELQKKISGDEFIKNLSPLQVKLLEKLEFSLTEDQMTVINQMNSEIDKSQKEFNTLRNLPENLTKNPFSMRRLLQGDVGSGKTLVAFFICLRIIDYGGQCGILAPTELLARQHAQNAAKFLKDLDVNVAFLTGNLKSQGRENLLNALKLGAINIVVGTHALFSTNTIYKNLSLVVIDEQHRFGVAQREAMVDKGRFSNGNYTHTPDVLMMSATPIPQSLALTAFGDLDVSVIKTMPSGRKAVKTHLSVMGHEQNVYEAVRKELEKGHQAYFVYPLIDESSSENDYVSSLKSAEKMYKFLQEQVYSQYRIELIHSKIDEENQNKILNEFKEGKIQILVATTVVEVGVDVANATCIVVEHADHFGLAELHQLRGRVGRSDLQSYCFLIYGKNITELGKERLKALHESNDGFYISEQDLKIRGPGEILGTAQSGYLSLQIADLNRDKDILLQARYDAFNECQKSMLHNQ